MSARCWLARRVTRAAATVGAAVLSIGVAAPPAVADAARAGEWQLGFLNVRHAHQISLGEATKIAVIDDPVPPNHPDLRGNVVDTRDFERDIKDEGHGLAVASLIAGHGHGPASKSGIIGLAPKGKIVSAVATHDDSAGEAVRWSVDQGVQVISISLNLSPDTLILKPAISYALANDVVVVAAAGNESTAEGVDYPGAWPGVLAVSAVDNSGRFSKVSVQGKEVSIAAPGEDIMVPQKGGGYAPEDGTSFAAPMVAGTAALIRSKYPNMNAASVINRLIKTADDKGPPGKDNQYGYGIVDPVEALTADIPDVETNPLGGPAAQAVPTPRASSPGPAGGDGGHDGGGGISPALIAGIAVAALALVVAVILLVVFLSRRGTPTPPAGPRYRPAPGYQGPPPRAGPPESRPYAAPPPGPGSYGHPPSPPYGPPPPPPGPHR